MPHASGEPTDPPKQQKYRDITSMFMANKEWPSNHEMMRPPDQSGKQSVDQKVVNSAKRHPLQTKSGYRELDRREAKFPGGAH